MNKNLIKVLTKDLQPGDIFKKSNYYQVLNYIDQRAGGYYIEYEWSGVGDLPPIMDRIPLNAIIKLEEFPYLKLIQEDKREA